MVSVKDGHGWFLSTGHVFGQYNAVWIDDRWYAVEVTHRWNNLSLNEYVILIKTVQKLPDKNYPFFRIAEDELSVGDSVAYVGFPSNRYTVRKARVTPYAGAVLHTLPHPNQGASGGGIVKGGNLYGIIHGYNNLSGIGYSHNLYPLVLRMKQDVPGVFTTNRPELKPESITPQPEKKQWPLFTPKKKKPTTSPASAPSVPKTDAPKKEPTKSPPPKENPDQQVPTQTHGPSSSTGGTQGFLSSVREKASDKGMWLDLLTGAALLAGTGGTGFAAWKGTKYLSAGLKIWKGAKAVKASFPPSDPMLQRDETELKQVISLREQEQRTPLHDGFFGVALEDEYRDNPDQTIREAFEKATARFNSVAPLSVKTTSSCKPTTGEK